MFTFSSEIIGGIIDNTLEKKNPSVAVSVSGRLFLSYRTDAYALVIFSNDGGKSWSTPAAVAEVGEGEKMFDNRVWIDPLGRLWFMWSVIGGNRVECAICDSPDADKLAFGDVRTLDFGLMLARPLVSIDGAWLFLSGVTKREIDARGGAAGKTKGMYVYESTDNGETFRQKSKPFGGTTFEALSTTEKVIYSRPNGVDIVGTPYFMVYAQVAYGVAKFVSPDGGVGFRAEADSTFGSYFSQMDINTVGLSEKKVLLVNNMHFGEGGKMCFCALFSNNRGDNYQGVLELEAPEVKAFFPDIAVAEDCFYVAYERERADGVKDIALSRFTEQDVIAYRLVDESSYLGISVG
jgi:hypothetical protein